MRIEIAETTQAVKTDLSFQICRLAPELILVARIYKRMLLTTQNTQHIWFASCTRSMQGRITFSPQYHSASVYLEVNQDSLRWDQTGCFGPQDECECCAPSCTQEQHQVPYKYAKCHVV